MQIHGTMLREMPQIIEYMTPLPVSANQNKTAKQADELMRTASIRHLPVLNENLEFVGVVTDREVKTALLFPGPGDLLLKDLIASPPFIVTPQRYLDDVVFEMMEHKHSCAIIEDEDGQVVGIFTEIDALRAFYELLGELYKEKIIWVA